MEANTTRTSNVSDLVRTCYSAYQAKDRPLMESLLAKDFTFSSPYDDRISRTRYFEKCWPNNERIRALHIQKIVAGDDEAFVIYELEPNAGGKFRNAEYFVFEAGKIKRIEVYFGDGPAGVAKESGEKAS
jgi:ketosteroid isomerase-like protein